MKKTIQQQLEEIIGQICDEYCRFPRECEFEDELMEHCETCPLVTLI